MHMSAVVFLRGGERCAKGTRPLQKFSWPFAWSPVLSGKIRKIALDIKNQFSMFKKW